MPFLLLVPALGLFVLLGEAGALAAPLGAFADVLAVAVAAGFGSE
jgi:hypothetical protein